MNIIVEFAVQPEDAPKFDRGDVFEWEGSLFRVIGKDETWCEGDRFPPPVNIAAELAIFELDAR